MRRPVLLAILVTLLGAVAVPAIGAVGKGALRDRIGAAKAREGRLGDAVSRLALLERRTGREVAAIGARLADAQAELDRAQGRLRTSEAQLRAARRRVGRLEKKLDGGRRALAELLRERYIGGRPDLVTVVLQADGFTQLLEQGEFVRRVQQRDAAVLGDLRRARRDVAAQRGRLAGLVPRQREAAELVARRRDGLGVMQAGLVSRQRTLARVRAARQAAIAGSRAGRRRAERELRSLVRARERAARQVGPGGPWAIPYPIVQCESGGQNLPPNFAGASGYYQFIPATWKGLGGSTPNAYQASKAEQDRLAARLWAGGAGARNWDCAVLVGLL